ncbi:MAG: sugar phosphate isomerase/epimerase [Chloroflexi bacterium]|nr:sugar phosphate isomerase/epimerase [Chloroflexota bacterium]MCI0645784.1 sugar phosphate isomerase/epimerase [Chloroflexota bacterium]MCI0725498.1 sugar phosphate isomerase/epimerase [Chloroflexota bacterium]
MDQVLVATDYRDVASYRTWAEEAGFGLELQAFSDPKVLANDWIEVLASHKKLLAGFPGRLGLHGAFYDMVSASLDPAIVDVTRIRYRQNLHAASELNAGYVVFHLNYMGTLKLSNYRAGWHQRQVEFWGHFAEEAAAAGVDVLLENLWEDDPALVRDILAEVNHPHLKACLDVAHATLFSCHGLDAWIKALAPYLICCHLNNHDGELDLHWPLGHGVLDYPPVLAKMRQLPKPPLFSLELSGKEQVEASLPFLNMR